MISIGLCLLPPKSLQLLSHGQRVGGRNTFEATLDPETVVKYDHSHIKNELQRQITIKWGMPISNLKKTVGKPGYNPGYNLDHWELKIYRGLFAVVGAREGYRKGSSGLSKATGKQGCLHLTCSSQPWVSPSCEIWVQTGQKQTLMRKVKSEVLVWLILADARSWNLFPVLNLVPHHQQALFCVHLYYKPSLMWTAVFDFSVAPFYCVMMIIHQLMVIWCLWGVLLKNWWHSMVQWLRSNLHFIKEWDPVWL